MIGDRGYRRKDLLHDLSQKPWTDFLIRLQGDLNVKIRGYKPGLLSQLAPWQPRRCATHWREDSKRAATTLPIETVTQIKRLVWLYSSRWTIETFFFNFKRSFGAHRFRVFSYWESVDRLLDLAHMAYLVLNMIYVLSEKSRQGVYRYSRKAVVSLLRRRSLKSATLTVGKFFEAIAIDSLESRPPWGAY